MGKSLYISGRHSTPQPLAEQVRGHFWVYIEGSPHGVS
jgi:hypothetical protein